MRDLPAFSSGLMISAWFGTNVRILVIYSPLFHNLSAHLWRSSPHFLVRLIDLTTPGLVPSVPARPGEPAPGNPTRDGAPGAPTAEAVAGLNGPALEADARAVDDCNSSRMGQSGSMTRHKRFC